MEKRQPILPPKPLVQSVNLVVDQCVHRVEDQATDSLAGQPRPREKVTEDREQETLRLAGARSGGHDQGRPRPVPACAGTFDGGELMGVERAIPGHHPAVIEVGAER